MNVMCIETKKLPARITDVTFASKDNIFDYIRDSDICWIDWTDTIKVQCLNCRKYRRNGNEKVRSEF